MRSLVLKFFCCRAAVALRALNILTMTNTATTTIMTNTMAFVVDGSCRTTASGFATVGFVCAPPTGAFDVVEDVGFVVVDAAGGLIEVLPAEAAGL